MGIQLRHADVFLFEPDDDCISRLICKLDNSPVSHSAIYYDADKHLMAESNLSGLQVNDAPGPPKADPVRAVHVRRYAAGPFKEQAVIEKAAFYLGRKERYGFATLLLAGALLITKHYTDNQKYIDLVEETLRTINWILENNSRKHPMTCSQFVAQCYGEAGYPLEAPARYMQRPALSLASLARGKLEKMDRMPAPGQTGIPVGFDWKKEIERILNSLCCRLEQWLFPGDSVPEVSVAISDELAAEIALFAALATRGEEAARSTLSPVQGARYIDILIDSFISPGDLLKCAQLETIGVIPGVGSEAGLNQSKSAQKELICHK